MAEHYFIYLGKEKGKRVVYKTGQTVRDCYARCKNADYQIGIAIDIDLNSCEFAQDWHRKYRLDVIEQSIVHYFAERFPVEHGREYFRLKKHNWEMAKELWLAEMVNILEKYNLNYTIYDGWVSKENYY